MKDDVEKAEQRARQYWYDDGLTEIAMGFFFLAIAALFLVGALAPKGSLPDSFSAIGLVVVVAGGLLVLNAAVGWAKERITYPRTGFVRYQRPPRTRRRRLTTAIVAAVVGIAVTGLLFATAPTSLDSVPALQGILIGAVLLYIAHSLGLLRLYLLGLASFALGFIVTWLRYLGDFGSGLYFAGLGLAMLLSGTVTLVRYLRHTQPPQEV